MIRLVFLALPLALAGPVLADCAPGALDGATFELVSEPPAPPDPALRPVRPDCLGPADAPARENCPSDVIAAYGAGVDAWIAALRAYVEATHAHANEVAVFANTAVAHARAARAHADAALGYAECEVAAIR